MVDIYRNKMIEIAKEYYNSSMKKKETEDFKDRLRDIYSSVISIDIDLLCYKEYIEYKNLLTLLNKAITKIKPKGFTCLF